MAYKFNHVVNVRDYGAANTSVGGIYATSIVAASAVLSAGGKIPGKIWHRHKKKHPAG